MQYRHITDREKQLIDRLLEEKFPGREEIIEQINDSLVRQWDENGSLEFAVKPNSKVLSKFRIPVEGESEDVDGMTIHILLHIVDGQVKELEIYKDDSSPVIKLPEAEDLRLFHPN